MTSYWKSLEQNKKFLRARLRDILWFSSQHALKLTKSKKRQRFDFKNFLKVSTLLLCKKNFFARKLFQWWHLSFFHDWNYRRVRPNTLTDLSSSCPRSLLKVTPTPPGCLWVPGGPGITPEPSFRGLVLDHQVLKELDLKKHSKTVVFDQI